MPRRKTNRNKKRTMRKKKSTTRRFNRKRGGVGSIKKRSIDVDTLYETEKKLKKQIDQISQKIRDIEWESSNTRQDPDNAATDVYAKMNKTGIWAPYEYLKQERDYVKDNLKQLHSE